MTDPTAVFRRLRRRFRVRGVGLFVAGIALALAGALSNTDRGAMGALIGVVMAAVGVYYAIWLPVFLRRPGNIARIDLHAPGDRYAMQVVMENGRVCRFQVAANEREQIKDALEKQIGINRLKARVVQR